MRSSRPAGAGRANGPHRYATAGSLGAGVQIMTFPSDRNGFGDESGGRPREPAPGPGSRENAPDAVPPPTPGPPSPTGYNAMAILSIIFAFLFAPLGIVFGHVAKHQIRRSGEQGDSLATAGLAIGYLITALVLVACCAAGVLIATGWATAPGLT